MQCPTCGYRAFDFERQAVCPKCGAALPSPDPWRSRCWAIEWKTEAEVFGWPLIHVAIGARPNRRPVVARGVIAIGQFACGFLTISQFGIGVFSVGQFALGGFVVAQMGIAYGLIAQMGLYIHEGHGHMVRAIGRLFGAGN